MKNVKNWRWPFLSVVLAIVFFVAGWKTSTLFNTGEEAMANFMSEFSALSYLQKGDVGNALLILRDSAERNLIIADSNGAPTLESFRPGATNRWFSEYAVLRKKLSSTSISKDDHEYDRRIDAILDKAVKKNATKSK